MCKASHREQQEQEHQDQENQCAVKIVDVHHCEVGIPRHGHRQVDIKSADQLAKEMTHDLDVNFNGIMTRLGKKTPPRNHRSTPRKLRTRR